ncbi:MAG: TonB-dependent receptor [Burkholderiales bacterium]|nr:TonB-dependent receptor [Burkholderiales bacterium]
MNQDARPRAARRPRPTRLGLMVGLALPALAAGPAHAQESAAPQTVVISAKGYASTDVDTPMSLTVIEREALFRGGALNPGEALRGQPGLAVMVDSAQGLNPVIRGLKKESVVLLVDGMRLNSAQPQGAVASFMSLGLADRLEVVKGPASVLYGTGALGGVVNVLLPQARFDPGLTVRASLGGESANEALRGAAVMNLSQGDHALMLGLAGARVHDYESPRGRVDRTGYDSGSAIAQYRMRIDARQQLRASYQRHRDDDVWYPGSIKPLPNPALGTSIVHSPRQQRELGEIGYSRAGSDDLPLNVDVRLYRQAMSRTIWSRAVQLNRETAQTTVEFETWGVDAKADWLVHPQHLLALGVSAWRMEASPERFLASPTPLSPLVRNDPFDDGRLEALGAFVQDDMKFGKLGVLAALRLDHVAGRAASMGNGAVTQGLSRSDNAASWSLGASYEVTPMLRPYASLARAFRAGEMRERFEASPRGDGYFYLGNPQIAPEKATQLELGVKGADASLSWSAAVFHNRITDYITGRPTGTVQNGLPVKATVNLGRVEINGLEAQARWRVASGQWLHAGLSVLRGENKDLDEPLFQMPADELSLGWDGQIAPGWSADATLRFVRRQDRVASVFSLGSENATPGFATADLGLNWRFARDQQLRLAVRNLADKTYHEHLTEGISGQEIPASGRSILVGWQGKF